MYEESKMEKLTINLPPVEIARIDVLVEAGLYPSRSEFIRAAIRKTLDSHSEIIEERISARTFAIGITTLERKTIEKAIVAGKKLKVWVAGMLAIRNDVTPELIEKGVESVKVYGILKAPAEVRKALQKKKVKQTSSDDLMLR